MVGEIITISARLGSFTFMKTGSKPLHADDFLVAKNKSGEYVLTDSLFVSSTDPKVKAKAISTSEPIIVTEDQIITRVSELVRALLREI